MLPLEGSRPIEFFSRQKRFLYRNDFVIEMISTISMAPTSYLNHFFSLVFLFSFMYAFYFDTLNVSFVGTLSYAVMLIPFFCLLTYSYHVISYHPFISYHIISYHIISYHFNPYHNSYINIQQPLLNEVKVLHVAKDRRQ